MTGVGTLIFYLENRTVYLHLYISAKKEKHSDFCIHVYISKGRIFTIKSPERVYFKATETLAPIYDTIYHLKLCRYFSYYYAHTEIVKNATSYVLQWKSNEFKCVLLHIPI